MEAPFPSKLCPEPAISPPRSLAGVNLRGQASSTSALNQSGHHCAELLEKLAIHKNYEAITRSEGYKSLEYIEGHRQQQISCLPHPGASRFCAPPSNTSAATTIPSAQTCHHLLQESIQAPICPITTPQTTPPQIEAHHTPTLSPPRTLLARMRSSTTLKRALILLPWLPIFGVAYHHTPIIMVPIEGPSMQPTINPSWNSNDDRTHTRTQVLVLKRAFTNTFLSRRISDLLPSKAKRADPTLQRGQIVVYRTPGDPDRAGVKRVVGVPGDCVTPLPGYPGGDTPVIIPYNHLWLEGDAGDRKKSVDSNYFGPISAQMITGRVLITVPSLHPWFTGTRWEDAPYPAETQHRVQHAVITPRDPDSEATSIAFRDGTISQTLEVVKAYPLDRPLTPMERQQWNSLHRIAREEKERRDTETYALANELEAEMRKKLFARAKTETLKNVEMSKEEFQKFKKDGVVPESVLARSDLEGAELIACATRNSS